MRDKNTDNYTVKQAMAFQGELSRALTGFQSGRTKNLTFRRKQLESLLRMYEENRDLMTEVLRADLRRPKQEAVILEIDFLINDLNNTLMNFEEWASVEKVKCYTLK